VALAKNTGKEGPAETVGTITTAKNTATAVPV
jgi:hypothetical protein